jgi:hypothetical protein
MRVLLVRHRAEREDYVKHDACGVRARDGIRPPCPIYGRAYSGQLHGKIENKFKLGTACTYSLNLSCMR